MLVLSRKTNEEIVIDGNIRVRVLEVRGGRVRLGIEAPAEVCIRRSELPARESKSRDNERGTGQGLLVCEADGSDYLLCDTIPSTIPSTPAATLACAG